MIQRAKRLHPEDYESDNDDDYWDSVDEKVKKDPDIIKIKGSMTSGKATPQTPAQIRPENEVSN